MEPPNVFGGIPDVHWGSSLCGPSWSITFSEKLKVMPCCILDKVQGFTFYLFFMSNLAVVTKLCKSSHSPCLPRKIWSLLPWRQKLHQDKVPSTKLPTQTALLKTQVFIKSLLGKNSILCALLDTQCQFTKWLQDNSQLPPSFKKTLAVPKEPVNPHCCNLILIIKGGGNSIAQSVEKPQVGCCFYFSWSSLMFYLLLGD